MQSWWPPLLPMNFLTGKPYICCINSLCSNYSYVHTHTCTACALFFVWTPHLAGFCTAGDPRKCSDEYEEVWKKGSQGIKRDSCWQCQGWGNSSSSWPGAAIFVLYRWLLLVKAWISPDTFCGSKTHTAVQLVDTNTWSEESFAKMTKTAPLNV